MTSSKLIFCNLLKETIANYADKAVFKAKYSSPGTYYESDVGYLGDLLGELHRLHNIYVGSSDNYNRITLVRKAAHPKRIGVCYYYEDYLKVYWLLDLIDPISINSLRIVEYSFFESAKGPGGDP